MKNLFAFFFLLLPVASFCQQGLLNKIKDKARARGEQRIDENMDKAIDKAEDEASRKGKSKKKNSDGETGEDESTSNASVNTNDKEKTTGSPAKVYSKYDFVRGERIVYAEDFSMDEVGELPLKWGTNSRGETVKIENVGGKWMQMFTGGRFVSPDVQKLPDNFTLEMEVLLKYDGEDGYTYPDLEFKLLQLHASDTKARAFLVDESVVNEVAFILVPHKTEPSTYFRSYAEGADYFSNEPKKSKSGSLAEKPFHISMWVQKERIRIWVDGNKVYDIPNGVPEKAIFNRVGFKFNSTLYTPEQFGVFVSNIVVAEGTADLRSKLLNDGKLVTTGILFDINSDRIKPESSGLLKEIATVLKENASVRIKILGHTDSDGDDAKNMELSKRRAAAVKDILNREFGIQANRLEYDGLGESKPVAENNSKEGKAKNRRVEFIKI